MSTVETNRTRYYNMAVPVGTVTNSPVRLGWITGHALNNRDAAGNADVAFGHEVEIVTIPVTARNPVPIVTGDELYGDAAAPTVIDNNPAGVHFGYALAGIAIVGGADTTATIDVIKGWL